MLVAVLATLAGACGVPIDDTVEVIDTEEFAALTDPPTTTVTVEPVPALEGDAFALYFINGTQELESVVRPFAEGTTLSGLVQALVEGPTADEQVESVLVTRLQPIADPRIIGNEDGTLTVLLADEAEVRTDENLRSIFGQLVCTMGRLVGVDRVALEDSEGPIPFSPGAGEPRPTVSIEEYGTCEPEAPEAEDPDTTEGEGTEGDTTDGEGTADGTDTDGGADEG